MDNSRKLLFVITQGHWGGAQRYIFDLASSLYNQYDITVAIGDPNGVNDLQDKLIHSCPTVSVVTLSCLSRPIHPIKDVLAVIELRRLYKKMRPDIVHLNSSKAGIIGSIASRQLNDKRPIIIYTVHGWVFNESISTLKRWMYTRLEKITATFKDVLVVTSSTDEATAHSVINATNAVLIPIGIDQQQYLSVHDARNELSKLAHTPMNVNEPWVGCVAGSYKTKGVDILIDAIAHDQSLRQTNVIVMGTGPEYTTLEKHIRNHDLTNVHLVGHVPQAALHLRAFDILVIPSRKEGLPYVLLEAMQAGTPVIATEVGGIPSCLQDKKNGLLVHPHDPVALSLALRNALSNPSCLKEYAHSAKTMVTQQWTKKSMVNKTEEMYNRIY